MSDGMNVNQLMQKLKKYPRDWKVVMVDSERIHSDEEVNVAKGDQEKKIVRLSYSKDFL
jgi:hypothetical protein